MVYVNGFNKQLKECVNGAYMLRFDDGVDRVSNALVVVLENESYIFSRYKDGIVTSNWFSPNAKIGMRFKKADTQFIKNLFSGCDYIYVGD